MPTGMSSNSRSNAVLATFSTAGIIVVAVVVVVSTFVQRVVTVQIEVGLGSG